MPNMLQAFSDNRVGGFTLMAKPPFSVSACDLNILMQTFSLYILLIIFPVL